MKKFPSIDLIGSITAAEAMTDVGQLDMMHVIAEQSSDLYRIGHSVIAAALASLDLESTTNQAILTGVTSYEVFGSVVQTADDLAAYRRDDILNISGGSEGVIDTLSSFEDAFADLEQLPELTCSMKVLIEHAGIKSSSEQMRYALHGAAMLRKLQLELDEVLLFRAELEAL